MSSLQLTYDEIFESFLGSITDYNLASLSPSDAFQLMAGYLRKAISKSYVKRLFSASRLNDETQIFSFTLKHPATDETDEDQLDFVKGVACKSMIIEWCEPQVKKTTNMAQLFGGKEQSFYSQSQHLSQLRELLADTKAELRQELGDRGVVVNTYLGTTV